MRDPRIGDIVTTCWSGKGPFAMAFTSFDITVPGGIPPTEQLLLLHIRDRAHTAASHEATVLRPNGDIAIIMSFNVMQFRDAKGT